MRGIRLPGIALAAALALPATGRGAASTPAEQPILGYLNRSIAWYRQQAALAQLATDPSDVVFADAERRQASDILRLAFAFARADVALQPEAAAAPGASGNEPGSAASLARSASDAAAAADQAQAAVDDLQRRLARAHGRARAVAQQQLAEARSELQLALARRDTLKTFADFVAQVGSGAGATGLLGQIDELQRSIPETAEAAPPPSTPAAAAAAASRRAAPNGILALASDVFSHLRKMRDIHGGIDLTERLRSAADKLRSPLLADLRATLAKGDQLSRAPDTADAMVLQQRTRDIDQLTAHFRKVSAALVPLGKQAVLLDSHRASLAEWHAAADDAYDVAFRALALHLGLLALGIAAILAASAFWRRATFRYVRDLRRRQQSLLARRIVVAIAVALLILFSLVTEFGSLATFAGFITAGLAVALQNVILSVAAYFFLIGRYGIRVGDRVQISGVTGDVLDIGLVRLHLMELRADGLPSGRVVVFSNSVLFQPNANFFKQLPGSNYAWHQVSLTLSPDTDFRHAERRILDAVEKVYEQYRDRIARQHEAMSQNLSVPVLEPRPQTQLHLAEAGLEMTIQFPVPLESASAVDDQVTRALLDAIEREPRLKLLGSRAPTIQAVPEPAHA